MDNSTNLIFYRIPIPTPATKPRVTEFHKPQNNLRVAIEYLLIILPFHVT